MYPQFQPVDFRSQPPVAGPPGTRFFPFLGLPFLAGGALGLLGGALIFGPRPFYPYQPAPCGPYPCGPYGGAPFGGAPFGGSPYYY
ncbi:hypothetical protein [Bacillus sp. 165]|uniref:hypothetical protein n=1 Tax=Bacillus sp. 165 TaxID=1529117 RepID=UPI001ADC638A|nr:hypothetical protein [Bacillus sp. 165]MBO9130360.1 hypothetical protein [Bacillus sp. 165]